MEIEELKQSYKNQLLEAGVALHRAEQAVKNITVEEIQLIRDIWVEWASSSRERDSSSYRDNLD